MGAPVATNSGHRHEQEEQRRARQKRSAGQGASFTKPSVAVCASCSIRHATALFRPRRSRAGQEGRRHCSPGRRAACLLKKATPQQSPSGRRCGCRQGLPIWFAFDDLEQHCQSRFAGKRRQEAAPDVSMPYLEQDASEGPHVHTAVDRLLPRLLRPAATYRQPCQNHAPGTEESAAGFTRSSASSPIGWTVFGEAEVERLDRAVGPDLDVSGLQVAVDDALVVCGFEVPRQSTVR